MLKFFNYCYQLLQTSPKTDGRLPFVLRHSFHSLDPRLNAASCFTVVLLLAGISRQSSAACLVYCPISACCLFLCCTMLGFYPTTDSFVQLCAFHSCFFFCSTDALLVIIIILFFFYFVWANILLFWCIQSFIRSYTGYRMLPRLSFFFLLCLVRFVNLSLVPKNRSTIPLLCIWWNGIFSGSVGWNTGLAFRIGAMKEIAKGYNNKTQVRFFALY